MTEMLIEELSGPEDALRVRLDAVLSVKLKIPTPWVKEEEEAGVRL